MRIALVTESFAPDDDPDAQLARAIVSGLVGAGHDVMVLAMGRGRSTFAGAPVFWAGRLTPVSAVRESLALFRPDVCHLVGPHRLGIKAADAAERLGVLTVVLDPRAWAPGVDVDGYHPRMRDPELHQRWGRLNSLDGGRLVVGYLGDLRRAKVLHRLERVARMPGVRLLAFGEGHGAEDLRTAGAKVLPPVTGVERARAIASLDVLLQPRKRQTYAPAVQEALASGVPMVGYAAGTAAAVVRHEHNGLLIGTDRGAKTLVGSVARLAADRDLHAALAARARDSVAQRTWDQAVSELIEVHYPAAVRRPSLATG
jgi:glycosyltransferase involved in cell wall biosynthesis